MSVRLRNFETGGRDPFDRLTKMPPFREHKKKWAVCHNALGNPSTYGWIKSLTPVCVEVVGTSGWSSPFWDPRSVLVDETEEEAKQIVDNYEKSVPRDPR